MVVEMKMEGVICNVSNYAPAMNPVFWLEGTEEANGTLLDGGTLY